MKYNAILFDLDGTFFDSIHGIAYSINSVLKKHGFMDFISVEWGLERERN